MEYYRHDTRPALPAEYADLKTELEQIGYVLRVVKRMTPKHRRQREEQDRAWRTGNKDTE